MATHDGRGIEAVEDTSHGRRIVQFMPDGPSTTRVELEHRGLETLGGRAESIRAIFDSPAGWMGLLERLAATTAA